MIWLRIGLKNSTDTECYLVGTIILTSYYTTCAESGPGKLCSHFPPWWVTAGGSFCSGHSRGEAVLLAFDSSHYRLWLSMTGWRRVLSRPQWSSPALSSPQLRLTPSCLTAAVSGVAAAENLRTSEPQSSESLKLPINSHATSLYFTARHSSMAQILGK